MSGSEQLQVYHSILGVGDGAGADEIRRAFRTRAMKLHPDVGGSSEQMQELNEAYRILSDRVNKTISREPISYYPAGGPPLEPVESNRTWVSAVGVPYEARWLITRSVFSVVLGLILFAESGNPFPTPILWITGALALAFLVQGVGMLCAAHRVNGLSSRVSSRSVHIGAYRLSFRITLCVLVLVVIVSIYLQP